MSWLRSDLGALREERPTSTMFFARATAPLSAAAGAAADKLVFVAQALVPDDAGPLFGQWCIADSDLAFALHRLILNGDQVPDRLIRFASAQWNRPSVQQFVHLPRPEA
jgi:glutathione S-transferase